MQLRSRGYLSNSLATSENWHSSSACGMVCGWYSQWERQVPACSVFILNLKASLFNYPSWAIYSRIDGQSVTLYISPEVNLAGMCYQHVIVISVNIGIVFYWLRPCLLVWLNVCLSAAYLPVTKVIRSKPRRTKANKVAVYQTSAVWLCHVCSVYWTSIFASLNNDKNVYIGGREHASWSVKI